MAEPSPGSRFRIVPREPSRRRIRGPGLAVIAVALYGLLFLVALLTLRSQIARPPAKPSGDAVPSAASTEMIDRLTLLSGEGLAPDARSEYGRLLSEDCCDCGCELTLARCLATDAKCTRSAEIASLRRAELQ